MADADPPILVPTGTEIADQLAAWLRARPSDRTLKFELAAAMLTSLRDEARRENENARAARSIIATMANALKVADADARAYREAVDAIELTINETTMPASLYNGIKRSIREARAKTAPIP